MELYFDDLNEDMQRTLLDFYGVERPEEMNWDVLPIAILYDDFERS